MKLAIYCAGGLGREILELARSINGKRWEEIFFVDDVISRKIVCNAKVCCWDEIKDQIHKIEFVIANGEPNIRDILYNKVKDAGFSFATIISAWASISLDTNIGEGCIIYDTYISSGVKIGANALINSKGIIGHDVNIGKSTVVSAMSFIGGGTSVGERSYIGPGSLTKDHVMIGDDSIVGIGSVVCRNVKSEVIVFGNPAKKIGDNKDKKVWGRF